MISHAPSETRRTTRINHVVTGQVAILALVVTLALGCVRPRLRDDSSLVFARVLKNGSPMGQTLLTGTPTMIVQALGGDNQQTPAFFSLHDKMIRAKQADGWFTFQLGPGRYMVSDYILPRVTTVSVWPIRFRFEVNGAGGAIYIGDIVMQSDRFVIGSDEDAFHRELDRLGIEQRRSQRAELKAME